MTNTDKDGKPHGKQIAYYANGNIWFIANYHHGKQYGYIASFKSDKTIMYKRYYNMNKWMYLENHYNPKQIEINI